MYSQITWIKKTNRKVSEIVAQATYSELSVLPRSMHLHIGIWLRRRFWHNLKGQLGLTNITVHDPQVTFRFKDQNRSVSEKNGLCQAAGKHVCEAGKFDVSAATWSNGLEH